MNKKKYITPTVVAFIDDEKKEHGSIAGALKGAAYMVGRSVSKALGLQDIKKMIPIKKNVETI